MIRVVTIGGEYGSRRAEIAKALAERLGWRLVDNCLIEDIARSAHLDQEVCRHYDEVTDPWFHRLRKALWQGGYEGVATTTEGIVADAGAIAAVAHRVIAEAAKEGRCVIVGRGAQCILQGSKDAFHVFIYGPREERIEHVLRSNPAVDAEAVTDQWDRKRAAYIRHHFGHDWTDRHLYDLMISSSIGEEAVVAAVLAALEHRKT